MVVINDYLKTWSEKLSKPIEEVQSEFNSFAEDEKNIHSDLSLEQQQTRALQRLGLSYKKQLRSPAIGFEGIIIGIGDVVDMVAKTRREAIEMFKIDPQIAITQGVTNEQGIPLDTRKEWSGGRKNNNFGKPLPEKNLIRNIFGVAIKSKIKNDNPKFFTIAITGDNAIKENMPIFTPLKFMAIDKTESELIDKVYTLNASSFTNFVVDKNLNLPKYEDLVKSCCKDINIYSNLKDLNNFHQMSKDSFNRIVITIGDVSSLNLQPTTMGSRVMIIEDSDDLNNLESKGTTCWIPTRINIDFVEGSKALIVGRTTQGKKKDILGNLTEELGDVSINVYGLYALPEYKIYVPKEITELTEQDIL
jgi:hypothetical protein